MSGSLSVPNAFATDSGNVATSQIDADFNSIVTYVNAREVAFGTLAARPAPGTSGRFYFATDTSGGTLYADNGTSWLQMASGVSGSIAETLTGLGLANDGISPNTVLDIAAGACSSDDATITNRILMVLGSAFTKTTGVWVVGSGNGGLANGVSVAASTWYHVFLIERPDTGVVDVAFDTDVTGSHIVIYANAAYTKKRRIGSFKTDGSSNILAFFQNGDDFWWVTPVLDVSNLAPGTTANTATLSVPTGVVVRAYFNGEVNATGGIVYVSALAAADIAPGREVNPLWTFGAISSGSGNQACVQTNTSAQVRYRVNSGTDATYIATLGWNDRRGRG